MANSINKELRLKTNEELNESITKMKDQLLQTRFSIANGEEVKLHNINQIKKTIARSMTIINERNNGINQKKEAK